MISQGTEARRHEGVEAKQFSTRRRVIFAIVRSGRSITPARAMCDQHDLTCLFRVVRGRAGTKSPHAHHRASSARVSCRTRSCRRASSSQAQMNAATPTRWLAACCQSSSNGRSTARSVLSAVTLRASHRPGPESRYHLRRRQRGCNLGPRLLCSAAASTFQAERRSSGTMILRDLSTFTESR